MECDGAAEKMEDAQSGWNPAKEQVLSVKGGVRLQKLKVLVQIWLWTLWSLTGSP